MVITAVILLSCGSDASNTNGSEGEIGEVAIGADGWEVPVDVTDPTDPTRNGWLALGWDTFVALSWPAEAGGAPGQPDEATSITDPASADGPVVWSTYLAKEQLLLAAGADPGTWDAPSNEALVNEGLRVFGGFTKYDSTVSDEFDEAFSNAPLIDTNGNFVLYEIRVNQAEYTYFIDNQYYNAAMQKAAFASEPATFVGFPKGEPVDESLPAYAQQGALEIKASWRVLTSSDDTSRYYTQEVYYESPDGTLVGPTTIGLVGFHILRLTPTTGSTWFWATFEQVDNLAETGGSFFSPDLPAPGDDGYSYKPTEVKPNQPLPSPTPVNVSRVYPIPSDVAAMNTAYQAALEGTVWQHYQLIDVQNPGSSAPCEPPNSTFPINTTACVNTDRLANVTMETYEQVTGTPSGPQSCVNCHGQFAFPQGAPKTSDYQVFSFLPGNATAPDGS